MLARLKELAAIAERPVSCETLSSVEQFIEIVRTGVERQNLVSPASLPEIWTRHVLDSAQLLRFWPSQGGSCVDIGSGAGFPGVVLALLGEGDIHLVEPRRLRAEFLASALKTLGASNGHVHQAKAESMTGQFDVITGRAVANLDRFLALTVHLAHSMTVWILPKGRTAENELSEARQNWHCDVRVEPSLTDAESRILVLSKVGARRK